MSDYIPKAGEKISYFNPARSSPIIWDTPKHLVMRRLVERRITPEVIQTFDIQPKGDGWQYPTPCGGLRWKNANSKAPTKYAWLEGRSESASALYYALDLHEAVQLSGGACWLAGGEPDLWALRSAGVYHALCGFSETRVYRKLAEFLQWLGVTDLYIAPDMDATGRRWAAKVLNALESSGIELVCKRLPLELGEKGDIGKAWEVYPKQTKPFERDLLDLPRWYPEPEEDVVSNPITTPDMATKWASDYPDIPLEYRQKIWQALGVDVNNFKGDRFGKLILCPFHKESRPSANLHIDWGLYCFAEGKTYLYKDIGEVLGLGSFTDATKATLATQAVTVAPIIDLSPQNKQVVSRDFVDGLCLEVRAALIWIGFTTLARVLDILYSNGWEGGEFVTRVEVETACFDYGVLKGTVRTALAQLVGKISNCNKGRYKKGRQKVRDNCCSLLSLYSFQHNTPSITRNNSQRGPKPKIYRQPKHAELFNALNIEVKTYYPIARDALRSAANYRAEVEKAPVKIKPGIYTRSQLTSPLGISATTSRAYDKRAGIEVTSNEQSAILSSAMIDGMPTTHHKLRIMRKKGKVSYARIKAVKPDGTYKFYSTCQESAARAIEFAGEAGKVYKVRQLANTYKPKIVSIESGSFTKSGKLNATIIREAERSSE